MGALNPETLNNLISKYLDYRTTIKGQAYSFHNKFLSELPDFQNKPSSSSGPAPMELDLGSTSASGLDASQRKNKMEVAIKFVQWMLQKEKGVIRMALGAWKLVPGEYKEPWWVHMLKDQSKEDLFELEKYTKPCVDLFVMRPPYTKEALQEQAEKGWRPHLDSIKKGFWATSDTGRGKSQHGTCQDSWPPTSPPGPSRTFGTTGRISP
jgi:hypothetical protein